MTKEIKFENPAHEWTPVQEKSFSITVRAWFIKGLPGITDDRHCWNVYANIFDNHPMFSNVEWAKGLPFHGGCTFDKIITTEFATPEAERYDWMKTYKFIKVGSDYAHYGDERFESYSPADGVPSEIQCDVSELAAALSVDPSLPASEIEVPA